MKNILIIFLFAFISMAATAQEKSLSLDYNNTFLTTKKFVASDTIAAGQTPYNINIFADKQVPCTQSVRVVLKKVGANANVSVQLTGSVFGDIYSNIGSAVVWSGSTADTTISIHNATANRYRYYDLKMSSVSGKAEVEQFDINVNLE
jgi:hypothetical protein